MVTNGMPYALFQPANATRKLELLILFVLNANLVNPPPDICGIYAVLSSIAKTYPDAIVFGSFNVHGIMASGRISEIRSAFFAVDSICVSLQETWLDP